MRVAVEWAHRNREVILTFALWGAVQQACDRAGLYAPADSEAWRQIAEAAPDSDASLEALILDLYSPDSVGHAALSAERAVLAAHQGQVQKVLASLAEGRYYVTICGALPLVEGTLAGAYGKWQKRPADYPLQDRLDESGGLDSDAEAELLLNFSAFEMLEDALSGGLPESGASRRHDRASTESPGQGR